MPKLSPFHWIGLIVFLLFYGFAVFALTRDYYLRHPQAPMASPGAPAAMAPGPESGGAGMGTSAIPESITETNPTLLHQRADALFTASRYSEAMQVYRRILELSPDDVEAYNELGLTQHYLGHTSDALSTLRTAVQKGPEEPRPWLTLGFVSMQAGSQADAEEALGKARDLDPEGDIGREAARLLSLIGGGP